MIESSRRGFLTGLIAFGVTAPAIVRATSLMPVKVVESFDVDEMVALLKARIEASEHDMARQMAQSLYANGERQVGLDSLTSNIQKDGWWKHNERVASIEVEVPYIRVAPKLVRDVKTGKWKFADGHLKDVA